jgi:hypothetical protein
MRRTGLLVTAVAMLFAAATSWAQLTITQQSFYGPGFHFVEHESAGVVTFDVGSSGANQSWTFGSYPWDSNMPVDVVQPDQTPYSASFPTATQVLHAQDQSVPGGSYVYERLAANGYYMLGFASADTTVVFDAEERLAALPATYQTSWTGVQRISYEVAPGFMFAYSDSFTSVVDGWGTVTTPYGTYPCLRVFSHHYVASTLNGTPINQYENLEYLWANQQALAVANVTSEDGVTNPQFSQGYLVINEPGTGAAPLRGPVAQLFQVGPNYPNPFNPTTSLPIALDKPARVIMDVYDETGRVALHRAFDLPAGSNVVPIDGSKWASGSYFARVRASGQSQVVKMALTR